MFDCEYSVILTLMFQINLISILLLMSVITDAQTHKETDRQRDEDIGVIHKSNK